MSDRIAIYNGGRIEQIGSAEELYERPESLFVADFVGESNVVHGTFDGRGVFDCPSGSLRVPPRGVTGTIEPDGQAAMVFRPERARIAHSSRRLPAEVNAAAGTVSELVYLGLARKCIVTTPHGSELVVRSDVKEELQDDLRPGDPVSVWWHPHESVVVPAASAR